MPDDVPTPEGPACAGALTPEQADARARILGAAFGAFMEKGYARTSTLEIASRAKVSKRDLYALVGNKQAIFRAGVSLGARRMSPPGSLPPPADTGALRRTLLAYGTRLLTEISGPAIVAVHRLVIAEAESSPELGHALRSVQRANHDTLARFFGEAMERGLLTGGEPSEIADLYLTILVGARMMDRLLGDGMTDAEARRRAEAAADAVTRLYPARLPTGRDGRSVPRPDQ